MSGRRAKTIALIKTGDVAAFERPFLDLGERVVAKSMDDRIGCAVAIELLSALKSMIERSIFRVYDTGGSWHARRADIGLRD